MNALTRAERDRVLADEPAALRLTIDGRDVAARPGETIIEVARRAGVEIPHLCWTPGLDPAGNCRSCVVEIDGERTLAASCCRLAADGMRVDASGERARRSQRLVVELLQADTAAAAAPPPTAGADELAGWAARLGVDGSRFAPREAMAVDRSHPAIVFDPNACIQCTRCLRACRDEQVNDVIGLAWRGEASRIVFDVADPMGDSTCVACGECVQACPTGALASLPLGLGAAVAGRGRGGAAARPAGATLPVAAAAADAPLAAVAAPDVAEVAEVATVADAALPRSAPTATTVDTLCPYCGVGCQTTVTVAADRIVAVAGRDGPANGGRLCVKGRYGMDYARHPERLTVPLIRRADAPKDPAAADDPIAARAQFREASWDEALAHAGAALRRLRADHGPRSLAGFGSAKGSNEEAYLFQKLVRTGFGSNNVDHCTRLCHASSVAALLEGLGSGAVSNPVIDVAAAEVVIVIGANPTVNHPVAATWIKNAVAGGTRLVVIDPRRNDLSRHATHVLQFRPDSDVALLQAMLHVIVDEGLVDRDFVARRTEGFDAVREQVRDRSPEAVAAEVGVDAGTIRTVARLYATSRASMILWGMGISQHRHGTDNARCLIALALATGQIGRPGTGLHPLRGQNNVQGASDAGLIPMMYPDYRRVGDPAARAAAAAAWGVDADSLDPDPGLTVVELIDAMIAGSVRGMAIMGENPAMSDPDVHHARQGLASLEMLVVQDIFLTETAALADVLLPASAFPEKTGTFTNTDRTVQLARTALPLPGQARQDLWIVAALAREMGLDWSAYGADPVDCAAAAARVYAEMRTVMPSLAGIAWQRLERDGAAVYPCAGDDDPGQPVVFTDRFPTPSGRGRFVPASGPASAEQPDADYPLVLITGRQLEHWHTGSMTRRSRVLDAIEPDAVAMLHPRELARLGLAAGDRIAVESRRGRVELHARADAATPPGTVFVAFCWSEAAINALTDPALDPVAKIPGFKYCAARVVAAPAETAVAAAG